MKKVSFLCCVLLVCIGLLAGCASTEPPVSSDSSPSESSLPASETVSYTHLDVYKRQELYQEGKIRAIGVCNFLPDRLLDLCYNAKILPQINQIERHPHYQRSEELFLMKGLQVQPEAWAPFEMCIRDSKYTV